MGAVLVVDDDHAQQLIVSKILTKMGLNVIVANDGLEALSLVESHRLDLVVLDISMPRMNGYEVCHQLKADEKTQKLPVVMYSSEIENCRYFWTNKRSADAYVSKLCHPQELAATIKHLLRKDLVNP